MCRQDWISQYYELNLKKKQIEKELSELKGKITKDIPEGGKFEKAGYEVNYQIVDSARLDIKRLKEDYLEVYNNCLVNQQSKKLTIKKIII